MNQDTTDKACEIAIENQHPECLRTDYPDTQPILEADVEVPDTQSILEAEVENGTEVQQLTSSNNRKCLKRPSKSCCVIIGILVLFCILVGVAIYAVYAGIVPDPADWFQSGLGLSKKFNFYGSSLKCKTN